MNESVFKERQLTRVAHALQGVAKMYDVDFTCEHHVAPRRMLHKFADLLASSRQSKSIELLHRVILELIGSAQRH